MSKSRTRRAYRHGPHIYARNGVWYAYTAESPKGRSLGTTDRADADRRFRELLRTPARAHVGGASSEAPLTVIVDAFLSAPLGYTRRQHRTLKNRLLAFGTWASSVGIALMSEITPAKRDAYKTLRMSQVSRRTLNRDARAVKVLHRWATSEGRALCAANPAVAGWPMLREPKRSHRRVLPDPTELRRTIDSLDEIHVGAATAVRALLVTGVRIEELRRLQPFDLRHEGLHVSPEPGPADSAEPGKGYRERVIPLHGDATAALKRFFAWRAGGKRRACTESWLLDYLKQACVRARVPTFTLHDLRRVFATEAFRGGVPLVVISRWLGHALVKTTEDYIGVYRSDRDITAPVPSALLAAPVGAESLQKVGVHSGQIVSMRSANERPDGTRKQK